MQNLEKNFFQKIDPHALEKINGIRFTWREIDILAFMVNGKSTKKIASLLAISPRTVENHVRNIMMKVECNSREAILDFMEKSKEITLLKKYYLSLRLETEFKDCLKEVSLSVKGKAPICKVLYLEKDNFALAMVQKLENYLKKSGVKIIIGQGQKHYGETRSTLKENTETIDYILCPISDENVEESLLNKENFLSDIQKLLRSVKGVIFLCETKVHHEILSSLISAENKNIMLLGMQENEYLFWFELLEKIVNTTTIETIRTQFIKRQKEASLSLEQNTLSPSVSHEAIEVEPISKPPSKKWKFYSTITALVSLTMGGMFLSSSDMGNLFERMKFSSKNITRSDLPIPAEPIFLSRPQVLNQIQDGLNKKKDIQVIALVGIGGAGKTTIARQYARLKKANIIWEINADTKGNLFNSFENLLYALCDTKEEKKVLSDLQDIKNFEEKEKKILFLLKVKLKAISDWILIYDNVERFGDIQKYFPYDPGSWGSGKVIITSRDHNIENNHYIDHIIPIKELSTKEKLILFNKIMRIGNVHHSHVTSKKFLDNIPPFPLDISTAAYYLKATNVSLEGYLKHLINYNQDFEKTQEYILKEASNYTKTRYSIITLSLKKIIEIQKDFEKLLLLISMLDSQNIPKPLLDVCDNNSLVDSFFYHLNKYSLIVNETYKKSVPVFSIHRNTQEIILAYLRKTLILNKDNLLMDKIAHMLELYITEVIDKEDFLQMKLLLPQGEAFLKHDDLLKNSLRDSLRSLLGCIYYYLSDYTKAKQLLEESLANLKTDYHKNHHQIARALMYLGNVYRTLGNYEKGKDLLEESLSIYAQYPGNYVGNGRALGYLGVIYRGLGDYAKARSLLEKSLEIYQAHSRNSIGHAWVLSHLGNTYLILGNYEKARQLLELSLSIYKKHSEDYVGVGWVLGYLGDAYRALGEYKKAKSALEQSLVICRKYFPETHVYISSSLAYSGALYTDLEEYEKAQALLEKSLKISEKDYGINHLQTGRILRSLGRVYLLKGDYQKAENLLLKSLEIFKQNKYSESYLSLENLAELHLKKDSNSSQSISYLEQALKIVQAHFPEDSSHLKRIQEKLISLKSSRK